MPVSNNQTSAGFEHNGCSHNIEGHKMADFTAKMLHNTKRWMPDSDGVVDHFIDVAVRAIRDGEVVEYTRAISLADWDADREGVIKKLAPRRSVFDDTARQLSRAIEVGHLHPELFPVRPEPRWRDENGEWEMNRRLCSKPVKIIAELKNNDNETTYRLLSGQTRIDVTFENLLAGNFGFPGAFQIDDKIGLFTRLRAEWASQTASQKLQFVKDEHLEHVRAIETKIAALGGY